MNENTSKNVIFLGCPMDTDERDESVEENYLLKVQSDRIVEKVVEDKEAVLFDY